MNISRRKLFAGLAAVAAVPVAKLLPVGDGIALRSMSHPVGLPIDEDLDFNTDSVIYKCYEKYSIDYTDPRGIW